MKKKIFKVSILILLFSIFILTTCNKKTQINPHKSVGETLKFLTSKECNGRLIDTYGNLLTQEFLISSLNSFGLEKLDGTFKDEFKYNYLNRDDISFELGQKEFTFGKDFSVNKISNSDLKYPLSTGDTITNDCIVLLDNVDNLNEFLSDDIVKGILVKENNELKPFTPDKMRISDKPMLYVTKDAYQYLVKNLGSVAHIKGSYTLNEKLDNNIIGLIRGKDAKKAVVLSAHFDHIGSLNNQIFQGAVDNASGTTALLEIAKNLSNSTIKESLNSDIFFAFFNAEEIGKLGSKSFAEKIQNLYGYENVININIDCIGDIDYPTLNIYFSNNNLQKTAKSLIDQLNKKAITDIIDISNNFSGGSDNIWFENNIYIYVDSRNIHQLKDTIKVVNIKLIEKISESITNLILNFPDIWETMRIPEHPDGDSENIRTRNRRHPDTLPASLIVK